MASSHIQAKAWEQVGARFAALGNNLRQRLDEAGADAATERRAVERSLQSLATTLEEGFERAGAVVRDVQLRRDIAEIVTSLRNAVVTTFATDGPATAKKATAKKATAKKATAKKATAKKATAKKATAKKATAKKATAKKATARTRRAG